MANIDYGHYVEKPIGSGKGTLIIPKGMTLHDTYIIKNNEELPFQNIVLEEGAYADICLIVGLNVNTDIPITVDLIGEKSKIDLSCAYICGNNDRVKFSTDVIHRVKDCVSNQLFVGIATDNGKVSFDGKITVAPHADLTEAYQTNRNIVLKDTATVNTKPQLEIYADDVKCSHGATIGALNEDEQFYMRQRGITEKQAKMLQALSFIFPVMDHIADAELFEQAHEILEESIKTIF